MADKKINNGKKLLFISHDASLTGAQILLHRLASEVSKRGGYTLIFVLVKDGPLKTKFEEIGPTFLWNDESPKSIPQRVIGKALSSSGLKQYTADQQRKREIIRLCESADWVIANSALSVEVVKELSGKTNTIFYIHELQVIIDSYLEKGSMDFINKVTRKVLVPSTYMKDFLAANFAFDPSKMNILKYIVPNGMVHDKHSQRSENFLVGACGTLHWRKGPDVFVNIVRTMIKERGHTDIKFTWLGAELSSLDAHVFINDLKKCGVEEYVEVVQSSIDVLQDIAKLDVFLLTSREDAYPLVVLEAASFGIPSIAFRDSGGIPEFISNNAGIVVDYFDIDGYCDAIISLKEDPALRKRLGEHAREKLNAHHADKVVDAFTAIVH